MDRKDRKDVIRQYKNAIAQAVLYAFILHRAGASVNEADRDEYMKRYQQHLQAADAMRRLLPDAAARRTIPKARTEAAGKGEELFAHWMTGNRKEATA